MSEAERFLRVSGWESGFDSVDRVLRHYRRKVRSEKTRRNILDALYALCRFAGKDPDELVRLSVEEASELVQSFLDDLAERGRSVRYVNVLSAYIKTFFRVNGFRDEREIRVERYFQPARYRKRPEYVPSPEEIERMAFAAGSKRNRALILMLYTTGLRVSTISALTVGDVIDEVKNGLSAVKVPVYPEMKSRVPGACKGNIPYYTFASKEAVEALKEYLEERMEKYGGLSDDEPLFCSDTTNLPVEVRRKTPIMRKTIQQIVKRAARKAGIERWRNVTPHCLRKAFESALRNSGLNVKDQEFLMGHILPGSQDAYYDYSKVEDLRAKYAQVTFFPQRMQVEELRKRQILDMVRLLGFPEDKIKRVEEALAKYATVDEAMDEIRKLSLEGYKVRENPNRDPKKIVDEAELEKYLAEGWDVQTVLPSGRILIKKTPA